jgi:prevent-host-death family protein
MIMTITSINTAQAKEEFSELINRVINNKERIILTRREKEIAAIISIDDLLLLQASENKMDLLEAVEALKEARNHGTISIEDLNDKTG